MNTSDLIEKVQLRKTAILNSLDEIVIVMDENMIYKEVYAKDESLLVKKKTELTGKHIEEVGLPAKALEIIKKGIWHTLNTGESSRGEYALKMSSGDHWFEMNITLEDGNTSPKEMVCLVRNITERKKIEDELKEAVEAGEKSNKAKTRLLATLSHEIRTPLNGIMGMLQLLQEGELDAEQRERVDIAYQSSNNLLCMINRVLDHSKMETGSVPIVYQAFSLRKFLEQLNKTSMGYLGRKNIKFTVQTYGDLPAVLWGDELRLTQVMNNLIANAIKFTHEGTVSVSVSLNHEHVNENNQISLLWEIKDTGIGIPSDKLGRIFESYVQADHRISRDYGGTGLGLTICKQIVEEMGGSIWVESQEGKGSKFFFTCTLCRAKEDHQDDNHEGHWSSDNQ